MLQSFRFSPTFNWEQVYLLVLLDIGLISGHIVLDRLHFYVNLVQMRLCTCSGLHTTSIFLLLGPLVALDLGFGSVSVYCPMNLQSQVCFLQVRLSYVGFWFDLVPSSCNF